MAHSPRNRRHGRRSPAAWGTFEQLPSGRWRAYYRVDGRKITPGRSFATRDDATAWLAAERADRSRGTWRDPAAGRITLADYAADWIDSRPDLAPRTREHYRRTLAVHILPRLAGDSRRGIELGVMPVGDITPATIRAWHAIMFRTAQERALRMFAGDRGDAADARAWARSTGRHVAATGALSPALLAAWRSAGAPRPTTRRPENAGATAAANAYRVLRTILNTAVQDGHLTTNPCQLKSAGNVRHTERPTATPAEVRAMAEEMPEHLSAAVTLAAWSGLRYGELFALARRHIDLDAERLVVERSLERRSGQPIGFGRTKTERSRRRVALPRFVVDELREHLLRHVPDSPDALLFTTSTGRPIPSSRLSVLFRRATTAIGRSDLRWHDLRHTGATLAFRAGASVPDVQARLGHTTMRAAQLYAHTASDADAILAQRLNSLAQSM